MTRVRRWYQHQKSNLLIESGYDMSMIMRDDVKNIFPDYPSPTYKLYCTIDAIYIPHSFGTNGYRCAIYKKIGYNKYKRLTKHFKISHRIHHAIAIAHKRGEIIWL